MSAIDQAPDCICGDERSEHKRGVGGCRAPDCGCAKYMPHGAPAAEPEPRPTPHLDRLKAELAEALRAATTARRQLNEAVEAEGIALDRAARSCRERDEAQAEVEKLRVQLEQAEQHARDLQDNGTVWPCGQIWDEHTRYLCLTCGSRYREHHNHPCGRLVPVRVVITFIENGSPTE